MDRVPKAFIPSAFTSSTAESSNIHKQNYIYSMHFFRRSSDRQAKLEPIFFPLVSIRKVRILELSMFSQREHGVRGARRTYLERGRG